MQRIVSFFLVIFFGLLIIFSPHLAAAQQPQKVQNSQPQSAPQEAVMKGKVLQIVESGEKEVEGVHYPFQNISVQILDGPQKGQTLMIKHGDQVTLREDQKVTVGETVVVSK